LNFVSYFIERIANSMAFLRENFRNDIGSELENILKCDYKCVLIANTFINSNRLLGESYFNYQRTANFKDKAFRMLKDLIIAG
jgi:hypothetical protein